MAFYKDTLIQMEAAIETQDWERVKEILISHDHFLSNEEQVKVEHDLSQAGFYIKKYDDALYEISKMLRNIMKGGKGNVETLIKIKAVEARESAEMFERILLRLIHEKKRFME